MPSPPATPGPVDPDAGPDTAPEATPRPAAVVAAVAAGGAAGAEARYALAVALPHPPGAWPWSTLLTNLSGCLLIGVLTVLVTERFRVHPLLRPLLGIGFLGGYTTFSTYAVETLAAVDAGHAGAALLYAAGTALLAPVATGVGIAGTRALAAGRGRAA